MIFEPMVSKNMSVKTTNCQMQSQILLTIMSVSLGGCKYTFAEYSLTLSTINSAEEGKIQF